MIDLRNVHALQEGEAAMSAVGQKRRFDLLTITSGLLP